MPARQYRGLVSMFTSKRTYPEWMLQRHEVLLWRVLPRRGPSDGPSAKSAGMTAVLPGLTIFEMTSNNY